MSTKVVILTVVLSVLAAVGITLIYKFFGLHVMLACCIVFVAISNLITAVELDKTSKKVKELEKKVDELTKK